MVGPGDNIKGAATYKCLNFLIWRQQLSLANLATTPILPLTSINPLLNGIQSSM